MSDEKFMGLALNAAKKCYDEGQLPIGAVLVIGGELVGVNGNSQVEEGGWAHHAENILIQDKSKLIKKAYKESTKIELYSTLEPCLMCLGAAVHNRVSRIVFACPDPIAGACSTQPPTEWYRKKWPKIERGPFARECYDLFVGYMEESPETWKNVLPAYRDIEQEIL